MGLLVQGPVTYDLARMVARKNAVVAGLVKGVATLFKAWNIEHVQGTGSLQDRQTIMVTGADGSTREVQADAIVVATGSSWPNLPQFPIDGRQLLTSQHLLDLDRIPASLLIVGAGVEGCEFAALYSGLGTTVTMVELMARVLPLEDEDISSMMERELKKRGVTVLTGTTVENIERSPAAITAHLKDGTQVVAEKLLVSVGRGMNSRGIGLEQVGVQTGRRGEILVNERMETTVPGIYAIGDVVGKAMLAHVASAQGKVAVENIMGHQATVRYDVIPAGIFTLPEIGRVGVTEQQARQQVQAAGQDSTMALKVGRFRYAGIGKRKRQGTRRGCSRSLPSHRAARFLVCISSAPTQPIWCMKRPWRCKSARR